MSWVSIEMNATAMQVPNGMIVSLSTGPVFVPGEKEEIAEFIATKHKEWQAKMDVENERAGERLAEFRKQLAEKREKTWK